MDDHSRFTCSTSSIGWPKNYKQVDIPFPCLANGQTWKRRSSKVQESDFAGLIVPSLVQRKLCQKMTLGVKEKVSGQITIIPKPE